MRKYDAWCLPEKSETRTAAIRNLLEADLGLSPIMAALMVNRGLTDSAEIERYLNPHLSLLTSPFDIGGMLEAAERIARAVDSGEKILIFGDYDADGICSVAALKLCLESVGASVEYYIPDRFAEGYGLNRGAVIRAGQAGFSLMVTVDCGVTAAEEVELAKTLGMDVVITDHHEPGPILPNAAALVNPKLETGVKHNELAGVGVVYQLIRALAERYPIIQPENYLDLTALATIADIVPLVGDNRILVKAGLQRIRQPERPGIRALLERTGLLGKEITTTHIGYILAPRLNAAGRMGETETAVQLLLSVDAAQAQDCAEQLDSLNRTRQEIEAFVYREALLEAELSHARQDQALVIAGENWHHGVLGIVASRLSESFDKPVILVSWEGEEGRGSGRSLPGIDMVEALSLCSEHLIKFGGHQMAAGITLKKEQFDGFRQQYNRAVAGQTHKIGQKQMQVEAELTLAEINSQLIEDVQKMEPFGAGNQEPIFLLRRAHVQRPYRVGKNSEHFKFRIEEPDGQLDAIYFKTAVSEQESFQARVFDLAFQPQLNTFRGITNVQMKVLDMKPASQPDQIKWASLTGEDRPDSLFDSLELCIHKSVMAGRSVLVVYPTVRSLEKHLPGLKNHFPFRMIHAVHGKIPVKNRETNLTALYAGRPYIFLTTTAFYAYYINSSRIQENCSIIRLWPDEPLPGFRDTSDNSFALRQGAASLVLRTESSQDAGALRKLVYANRRSTLAEWLQCNTSWVEAGIDSMQERYRIREQYMQSESSSLIWDAVAGGGLPSVSGDVVIFADVPFGIFEVDHCLSQISHSVTDVFFHFSAQEIDNNWQYLNAMYPDVACIAGMHAEFTGQEPARVRLSDRTKGSSKAAWENISFQSALQILKDIGRCEYSVRRGIYDMIMTGPEITGAALEASAFFQEGVQEKRLFQQLIDCMPQEFR